MKKPIERGRDNEVNRHKRMNGTVADVVDDHLRYRCVHCGSSVPDLYKDFGQGAIRLTDCSHCGKVADPYVEVDALYLFLEVFLQKESVYRHILFNSESYVLSRSRFSVFRLLIGLVIFDAYARWASVDAETPVSDTDVPYFFFSMLACSATSLSAYLGTLTWLGSRLYGQRPRPVFHGILVSMFGILFNLLLLTWASDLRFRYGIQALVYTSNLIALKVISHGSHRHDVGYGSPLALVCCSAIIRYLCLTITWTLLFKRLPRAADLIA